MYSVDYIRLRNAINRSGLSLDDRAKLVATLWRMWKRGDIK